MKVQFINIWGFTRLRYFSKCINIVIKSIAKISYITSYALFRTGATVKLINSKICVVIYNSLSNILIIPISVFRLPCLLYIYTYIILSIYLSLCVCVCVCVYLCKMEVMALILHPGMKQKLHPVCIDRPTLLLSSLQLLQIFKNLIC